VRFRSGIYNNNPNILCFIDDNPKKFGKIYRGIKILRDNDKPFACLVAIGLSFNLSIQALVNMAVSVNLFPVTGQTLPLISMGGTSIWFTMISLGIILSISRGIEEKTEESNAEYSTDINTEESMQRLPTFGRMYDLEEESGIDKIKKEMNVVE
jgi:hypothetical protein